MFMLGYTNKAICNRAITQQCAYFMGYNVGGSLDSYLGGRLYVMTTKHS